MLYGCSLKEIGLLNFDFWMENNYLFIEILETLSLEIPWSKLLEFKGMTLELKLLNLAPDTIPHP